ncbi:STAS domain-containing protein [Bacillus sp. B1-b2]|uniref:STAS domain-containing protein n=1 Tax=Bacillus sp. B1-b2 TaxID=2653201 RepID=UPI001261DED2|nr:STAS domain-containing protein [Bacillus sp. B1-b2]KAB7671212.1 STAS domain-containing protein [Bacillus sp. B1-b2]
MTDNKSIKIESSEFSWNTLDGVFHFDGAPALLFWDSAFEIFFSTIMEISGSDASNTVFEATGFRMGLLVNEYYQNHYTVEEVMKKYSEIYSSAGWGNIEILNYDKEAKTVTVQLRNSWEQRILRSINSEQSAVLLPCHWAGVFSGLFKENMWYSLEKSKMNGDEYDEVKIFPSTITPNKNIHELARQKEQAYINELEQKVDRRTEELSTLIKTLSTPVMPVMNGILAIPLIGKFNEERFEDLLQKGLSEFKQKRASYLLLDLTGIKEFDGFIIHRLQHLIKAIELIGGNCVLVGISPSLSMQIIHSGADLNNLPTFSTLEQGIQYAIEELGYQIVKKEPIVD